MYEFSIGSLIFGLFVFAAGGAMVLFYRQIAENFAYGVHSYDKIKLRGLIVCGVGIFIMLNLHALVINWLFQSLFA